VYVYFFNFVGAFQYFGVDFSSWSMSEAVLKFYPAVAKVSNVSSVCLRFSVDISPAVELLIDVTDMSEDSTYITMGEYRSFHSVHRRQQIGSGRHSITVLRGQQYVTFTAKKIKVNRIPDRVYIHYIQYKDGSCRNEAPCE